MHTRLYGVTTQNSVIFTLTAVRTYNIIYYFFYMFRKICIAFIVHMFYVSLPLFCAIIILCMVNPQSLS